jgi:hypothetical protein
MIGGRDGSREDRAGGALVSGTNEVLELEPGG